MKAALDKAADRYTTDIRSLLREKKVQYARHRARGHQRRRPLPRRRRARARRAARSRRPSPTSRCATPDAGRRLPARRGAQARGAEAHPGRRGPAEHHDPAQPRQRARRRRADRPAAGRRPRRRAAARRAGHRARQGHPRPHRDARDPHGRRGPAARSRQARRRPGAVRQRPLHRAQRRAGARAPPGRADRRPHQRRAARLRPAHQRARRARRTSTARGARIFKEVTRENVGKRMAIVLVEKGKAEVITAPVIREEIGGGRVQISGRMTTREANDIALLMRAGALAAPMEIVEERTVGPSLGKENIDKGFNSVLYGFIVLALFMCVVLPAVRRDLDDRAVGQPAAAGRAAVDAAGDADAARHRRHRADARHGDRRQRADQRAHPRGAALGRDAAGGDHGGLRARLGHDPRLERDDADRRPRAADLRHAARCAASRSSTASAS